MEVLQESNRELGNQIIWMVVGCNSSKKIER